MIKPRIAARIILQIANRMVVNKPFMSRLGA
jgi:hypothetical protein